MDDVIRFDAMTASDNITDMYDADNFYPYDGLGDVYDEDEWGNFSGLDADGEGLDIEYSEAFGDFMKKIGGAFKKGGLKKLVKNRRAGLDDRLAAREDRIRGRQDRRKKRLAARERRKNLRQVALVKDQPVPVQQNIAKIVTESVPDNPTIKAAVDNTAAGEATPPEEQTTMVVVKAAQDMTAKGETDPPKITTTNEVQDGWWKKQNIGVKIAIIGGGVVVLGLGIWGITKLTK